MDTGLKRNLDYDGGDAAKRVRVAAEISKVLHVRNLPPGCADQELMGLCAAFGIVEKVFIMVAKGQGFVQMQDPAQASQVVQYYSTNQVPIRGHHVKFQFSNRSELVINDASKSGGAVGSVGGAQGQGQGRILLASITNLVYPVNVDVIHQVFSPYGQILRVVCFSKEERHNALVEFAQGPSAASALAGLDNQDIYHGCNKLSVRYSNLPVLQVRRNDDMSRDFTNPSLGGGGAMGVGAAGMGGGASGGLYGAPAGAEMGALGGLGGMPGMGGLPGMGMPGMGMPGMGMPGVGMPGMGMVGGSPVMFVSGIPTRFASPPALFTLFGAYGDVVRVKLLYQKEGQALVQFKDHAQAQRAQQFMNNLELMGSVLHVNTSKHNSVAQPKTNQDGSVDASTMDFANHPAHRFRKPSSKGARHLVAPTLVLHVSNLPESVQSDEALQALVQTHATPMSIKFFDTNRRMALVAFASTDDSVSALVGLDNQHVEGSHVRVSFTKSTI